MTRNASSEAVSKLADADTATAQLSPLDVRPVGTGSLTRSRSERGRMHALAENIVMSGAHMADDLSGPASQLPVPPATKPPGETADASSQGTGSGPQSSLRRSAASQLALDLYGVSFA